MDLDLALGLDPDRIDQLIDQAERAGFALDPPELRERFKHQMLRLWHSRLDGHPVKVDVQLAVLPHMQLALKRRRKKRVGRRFYWFASPEDMIILKLIAARDHDLLDAAFLLAQPPGSLDRRYLERTVGEWHLEQELAEAERRTREPPE